MSLNVNVVPLSYFMFVYFLVCLQLHVSNKVGLRRRRRRKGRHTHTVATTAGDLQSHLFFFIAVFFLGNVQAPVLR